MCSSFFPKAPRFANVKFSFILSVRHFFVNMMLRLKDRQRFNSVGKTGEFSVRAAGLGIPLGWAS